MITAAHLVAMVAGEQMANPAEAVFACRVIRVALPT
jgi:hypothetical protein